MSTTRIINCDRLDCDRHVRTDHPPPHLPGGFIELREGGDKTDHIQHACSWTCAMVIASCPPDEEFVGWLGGDEPDNGGTDA